MTLCYPGAFAIGFGDAVLRSNLGETLKVQIPLTGATDDVLVPSCVKPSIETLDGEVIENPRVEFVMPTQPNLPVTLNLVSRKIMVEPVVRFRIAMTCGTAIQRVYPLLLDFAESPNAVKPAQLPTAVPAPQTSPLDAMTATPPAPVTTKPKRHADDAAKNGEAAPRNKANTGAGHKQLTESLGSVKPSSGKHGKHAEQAGRDVLKVSSDDLDLDPGLKMSQALTQPDVSSAPQTLDQQRLAENKIAQAQFSAIMRGEDPLVAAQNEIKKQELKAKNLQAEIDRLNQQAAAQAQKSKELSPTMLGMIAAITALFVALIGVVAAAIYRSRKNKESTWWDTSSEQKKNVVDIVDYLQTTAEEGNLDPNPITAAREHINTEHGEKQEVDAASADQEEPSPKFKRMGLPALEDTNSSTFNFFSNRGQSIHIEEISDITQEAEFWMSVNDPHRAIEILEPQSLDENQATPVTWLYLLDLYRLVGDENNYNDLRHRFKLKFNAKIPTFSEEVVAGAVRSFEDFPHLIANCCALWNSEDIFGYLESLLVDDREGERVGFDLPVYRDILFLLQICNELKRLKYNAMPKDDNPVKHAAAALEIPPAQAENLAIKPEEPESGEYSNSLNFDLLDFKSGNDEKG